MREMTSLQNPLVKHLAKLRKERSYRTEQQSLVIEGIKLVTEVCSVIEAKTVLFTQNIDISEKIISKDFCEVSPEIIEKISGLVKPEGILAEIPIPPQSSLDNLQYLVALDGISDPGNLGTLLRTALALGWQGVYILNNCCDPYNDKALRAAKGATFRLPLRYGEWSDLEEIVQKNQLTPICADINGGNVKDLEKQEKILLVLGNESLGLSEETLKHCHKVTIPMTKKMESLNVSIAGGILMHLLRGLT